MKTEKLTHYLKEKKEDAKEAFSVVSEKTTSLANKGAEYAKEGANAAKKGAHIAKNQLSKAADNVAKTSKEAQMAVLKYVDERKNRKYISSKLSAFEDGLKEGKIEAVDYIKKYANFCLATTAVSFFFARCDGEISKEERLEIQFDLDSIVKNKDLPVEIRAKLAEISLNTGMKFDDVAYYLDQVGIETVLEFQKDIEEIILADGTVTEEEKKAKQQFDGYLQRRLEAQ